LQSVDIIEIGLRKKRDEGAKAGWNYAIYAALEEPAAGVAAVGAVGSTSGDFTK
jgi:hypothetical protein